MRPRWRFRGVIAVAVLAFCLQIGNPQMIVESQDYAVLVERASNRKYFNSYGLLEGNTGRGTSTLLRLKTWQGFSQASFEWNITKLHISGPIITSKLFVAGGVVWALMLDLKPNSTRAKLQGRDTVSVMLTASWAAGWHDDEHTSISIRLALPNAAWDVYSSARGPSDGTAVFPDVAAVLTRNETVMLVADLNRGLLERGLLGGADTHLLIRVHLLNVTTRWREDSMHPEAQYGRAVRQQVSAAFGADSYGVRHLYDSMVSTTVINGGSGGGESAYEAYTQYQWREMSYNTSVIGELLWYLVLENLRCHGLDYQEAQNKIDAVVGMCDIIVGRITSHPRVHVVAGSTEGIVQYLDEHGDDLRKYRMACKSSSGDTVSAAFGGSSTAARTYTEKDMVHTAHRTGSASGGYDEYIVYDTGVVLKDGLYHDGWRFGWTASDTKWTGRRWRSWAALAAALLGFLGSSNGSSTSDSAGAGSSNSPGTSSGSSCLHVVSQSVYSLGQQQHTQGEQSQGWDAMPRLSAAVDSSSGGNSGGSSAAGAFLSGITGSIARWWFFKAQNPLLTSWKSQPPVYDKYDTTDEEVEELLMVAMVLLGVATLLAVVLVLLVRGKPPRALIRLWISIYKGFRGRGPRRDRTQREHVPTSLLFASATATPAAVPARRRASNGVGNGGAGRGVGPCEGSRVRIAAAPPGISAPARAFPASIIPFFQLSKTQTQPNTCSSSGGSGSAIIGIIADSRSIDGGGGRGLTVAAASTVRLLTTTSSIPNRGLGIKSAAASPPASPLRPNYSTAAATAAPQGIAIVQTSQGSANPPDRRRSGGLLLRLSSLPLPASLIRPWTRGSLKRIGKSGPVAGLTTAATAGLTGRSGVLATWACPIGSKGSKYSSSTKEEDYVKDAVHMQRLSQPQHMRQLSSEPVTAKAGLRSGRHQAGLRRQQQASGLKSSQAVSAACVPASRAVQSLQPRRMAKTAALATAAPLPPSGPKQRPLVDVMAFPAPLATRKSGEPAAAATVVSSAAVVGTNAGYIVASAAADITAAGLATSTSSRASAAANTRRTCVSRVTIENKDEATPPATVKSAVATSPARTWGAFGALRADAFQPPTAWKASSRVRTGITCPPQSPTCNWSLEPKPAQLGAATSPMATMTESSSVVGSAAATSLPSSGSNPGPGHVVSWDVVSAKTESTSQASKMVCAPDNVSSKVAPDSPSSTLLGTWSASGALELPFMTGTSSSASLQPASNSRGGSVRGSPHVGESDRSAAATDEGCSGGSTVATASSAAAEIAAVWGTPLRRHAPKPPWSLVLLAEMASDSAWRRRQFQPGPPCEFACLACMDAPRECGFLHGGVVHMGLCGECASRLVSPPDGGLTCPVCKQPVDRVVEVVL